MDTNNHPLIGKRIEHKTGMAEPCTVAHVFTNADSDVCALVIMDDGAIDNVWLGGPNWRIVTPKPTATAAPEPDADGWIPLDGTRPHAPGRADIVIKCRDGLQIPGTVDSFDYRHNGNNDDAVAWRRA
jgi:hypothetical protein